VGRIDHIPALANSKSRLPISAPKNSLLVRQKKITACQKAAHPYRNPSRTRIA
jgi:hypothetical protein